MDGRIHLNRIPGQHTKKQNEKMKDRKRRVKDLCNFYQTLPGPSSLTPPTFRGTRDYRYLSRNFSRPYSGPYGQGRSQCGHRKICTHKISSFDTSLQILRTYTDEACRDRAIPNPTPSNPWQITPNPLTSL